MSMLTRHHGILFLAILVVTLVALGVRLKAVDLLPQDYDEDDYLYAAQYYAQVIKAGDLDAIVNYDFNYEHPPLTKLVYGLALLRLPDAPPIPDPLTDFSLKINHEDYFQAARYLSLILSTFEVLALAILDPLAGFLLAIHTYQIKYTSQVMLEPLPALTSLLTVLFYLRWKKTLSTAIKKGETPKNKSNCKQSKLRPFLWLILSAVALGLTAASKYTYCIVGIAILVDWIWLDRAVANLDPPRDAGRGWHNIANRLWAPLLWGALAVVVFFIFNPWLWSDPIPRLAESVLFHSEYAQSDHVRESGFPIWQPLVWLASSVNWHPGVFVISLDLYITILAIFGLRRLWKKMPVFVLWLGMALVFLLIWPTKWPQYILILTAPLSLSAAEGFRSTIWAGAIRWWQDRRTAVHVKPELIISRRTIKDIFRATPWLLPGMIVLGAIALFPMVFQLAMSLTDFSSPAIRDGLGGGVWREAWLGLTGQVEPVVVNMFNRSTSKQVNYAGPSLIMQLLSGAAIDLVVFGVLWTGLSVSAQTALGVGVALMLNRRSVRFSGWWRAIFILPWAIPEFVGALIWSQIFDPRFGWFNQSAKTWYERADYPGAVNFIAQWQEDPTFALVVLLITATWYGFPLMMLAASAGLKLMPAEVFDAAAIDGASAWRRFRWITWPLLLPLIVPAIIIRVIFAFNQFYLFYVLRPPYPLMTFSITSFFFLEEGGQYAISAAINIFTVIVLVVLILLFNRWSRASEGVTYA